MTRQKTRQTIELAQQLLMNIYPLQSIVLDRGEGCYLYDLEGNKYLDFAAGVAVNALGYQNADYIEAATRQLHKIIHCPGSYCTEAKVSLAAMLVENSCCDRVFFCNSGTEAVEAAFKLARKYAIATKGENAYEVIAMENSFHGRTIGALSLTLQDKYHQGFGPLVPGVRRARFNDIDSIRSLVNDNTAAVIIEPIQGEGGIIPGEREFLQQLRNLTQEREIALIFDEIQCGIGRTGKLFAYQWYGVEPDIITLAKGLGAGFPIGAMIAKEKFAHHFTPGSHASTFGGNPFASAVAVEVLQQVTQPDFLSHVEEMGNYLREQLLRLQQKYPCITAIRGLGLMQAVVFAIDTSELTKQLLAAGLMLLKVGSDAIRLVPPLVIEKRHVDEAMAIFERVLAQHSV